MASKKTVISVVAVVVVLILIIVGILIWSRSGAKPREYEPIPRIGPIELPKAPHWDAERQCFFFVDIFSSTVHKYDPANNVHKWAKVGTEPLAFIIPVKNTTNKFIISYGPYVAILTWDGNSETTVYQVVGPIDRNVYRANEGKVAPSGSLFIGTHSPVKKDLSLEKEQDAGLYACDKYLRRFKKLLDNVTIANGMGWNKEATKFYFIDSGPSTLESFSYNKTNDELTERKMLCNFKDIGMPGVADGMAIDDEDKLWVTLFGGHQVVRVDPDSGALLDRINVDALKVTSVAFGGPTLSNLFITSGNFTMTEKELKEYPHSGYFFEISNYKVRGRNGVTFELEQSYLQN